MGGEVGENPDKNMQKFSGQKFENLENFPRAYIGYFRGSSRSSERVEAEGSYHMFVWIVIVNVHMYRRATERTITKSSIDLHRKKG